MKGDTAFVLFIILLFVGLSMTVFSARSVEGTAPESSTVGAGWHVTGPVQAGEIIGVNLKGHNNWGQVMAGEEFDSYPVNITLVVVGPDGGETRLVCNYSYQMSVGLTSANPELSPLDVLEVKELNNTSLDVTSVGTIGGQAGSYIKAGTAKSSGDYTVSVDQESILYAFLSTDAPRKLDLFTFRVDFPYMYLLPVGVLLLGSSAVALFFAVKPRIKGRRAPRARLRTSDSSISHRKKN